MVIDPYKRVQRSFIHAFFVNASKAGWAVDSNSLVRASRKLQIASSATSSARNSNGGTDTAPGLLISRLKVEKSQSKQDCNINMFYSVPSYTGDSIELIPVGKLSPIYLLYMWCIETITLASIYSCSKLHMTHLCSSVNAPSDPGTLSLWSWIRGLQELSLPLFSNSLPSPSYSFKPKWSETPFRDRVLVQKVSQFHPSGFTIRPVLVGSLFLYEKHWFQFFPKLERTDSVSHLNFFNQAGSQTGQFSHMW